MNGDRLLVVTGFWPDASNPITGIFVVQQVAAMVRAGFMVTVVLPKAMGKGHARPLKPSELGLAGDAVEFHQVPYLRLPEALTALPGALALNVLLAKLCIGSMIRRILRGRAFRVAIIHGLRYCGFSSSGWAKSVAACITVMHGFDPFLVKYSTRREVHRAIRDMAEANESVVLVGSSLRAHARAIGLPDQKIRIVLNGTVLPDLSNASSRQRPLTGRRHFLSVSNLVRWKGIDLNVRALAALRHRRPDLDWEYRVVGDGPMRESLRQLTESLGISDRVVFLGRLDYAATMGEMGTCDVFSLPSWGEAFGIVYLEAMARMRPVVGCFRNGAEDIIDDGVDGCLVPPGDVETLSLTLERLLENPELCIQVGVAARNKAEQFNWDINVRQLLSLPVLDDGVGPV